MISTYQNPLTWFQPIKSVDMIIANLIYFKMLYNCFNLSLIFFNFNYLILIILCL